jgi:hypothetical protein
MKTYEDLNELYNNIRDDIKDLTEHDTVNIIQELIYSITEDIDQDIIIKEINDIIMYD